MGQLSQVPGKHYPKLEKLLQSDEPRKPQSRETMIAMVKALHTAFGGKLEKIDG